MKEWNELLKYIDEYVYMKEEEEVIVRYSHKAGEAKAAYEKGLKLAGEGDLAKWEYDIALDCVRRMSPEDRVYITKNLYASEYHFGYAMGIRNKYIHPATKHSYFEADGVSSSIMRLIFSIISPYYDYRNKRCVDFFDSYDVKKLIDMYGERYPHIIGEFINEVTEGASCIEATNDSERLKSRLRKELGKEEFIRLFKEAYHYYNENEKQNKREDWYWNTNFPGVKAILYPLESNQLNALRHLNFFWHVESGAAKSIADCRKFIDDKLGLRTEDADFMARCFWEVCSPYFNGTWRELPLHTTKMNYVLQWRLEQEGLKTIGDLLDKTESEWLALSNINKEDVSNINAVLSNWLSERNLIWDRGTIHE